HPAMKNLAPARLSSSFNQGREDVHRLVNLFIRVKEVRRDTKSGRGTRIDKDAPFRQLFDDRGRVIYTKHHRPAASVSVEGRVDGPTAAQRELDHALGSSLRLARDLFQSH